MPGCLVLALPCDNQGRLERMVLDRVRMMDRPAIFGVVSRTRRGCDNDAARWWVKWHNTRPRKKVDAAGRNRIESADGVSFRVAKPPRIAKTKVDTS
jgi:hypothetical protein